MGVCSKCGGHHHVGDVGKISMGLGGTCYGVQAAGFTGCVDVPANVQAWICCECGFTELYTMNFVEVARAVDQALSRPPKPAVHRPTRSGVRPDEAGSDTVESA